MLTVVLINPARGAPIAHAAQDFSLSAEGYDSALAILPRLAEDKLHINHSDIIPFFTNSMRANSHYRNACCSKMDCIRIRTTRTEYAYSNYHFFSLPLPSLT